MMDAIEKIKDFWPEWTIEGPLGRGSYGKVYSASRSDAGKKYYSAIKVMTIPSGEEEIEQVRAEGLDEQSTREYFREIVQGCIQEITMMMDYRGTANIVNVEDYKVIEHTDSIGWDIFIRMEKLLCLKEIMKKRTLTEEETVNLGINISTALIDCEVYKLGDFGIATRMSRAERGMSRKGTYDYMAPEIFTANSYDQTVDIYALGLVLYRLCNENKGPFIDLSSGTLRPSDAERAHGLRLSGIELPAPAHASADLAKIIAKAVRFRPEERYRDAKQLKDALEELKLKRRQAKADFRYGSDAYGSGVRPVEQTAPYAADEDVTELLTYVSAQSRGSGSQNAAGQIPQSQISGGQIPQSQIPQSQIPQSQIPQSQITEPDPAESDTAEPDSTEPDSTESDSTEPDSTESDSGESDPADAGYAGTDCTGLLRASARIHRSRGGRQRIRTGSLHTSRESPILWGDRSETAGERSAAGRGQAAVPKYARNTCCCASGSCIWPSPDSYGRVRLQGQSRQPDRWEQ